MAIIFELRERRERNKGPWEASENDETATGANLTFDNEGTPLLRDNQDYRSLPRRVDPNDHPLAPHRLNPDPDSPSSSLLAERYEDDDDSREQPRSRNKKWWSSLTRGRAA